MKGNSRARLIVRLVSGNRWFPPGIVELVAYSDDVFLSIALTSAGASRGAVYMEEFACDDAERCARDLRWWLRSVALTGTTGDPRTPEWADWATQRIIDALREDRAS